MLLNCGVGEDSWESLGLKGDEVSPKGNQPWIFTGRTDAEVEAPVLWPPDVKSPVQFNHLVMFDSLGPHGLQHARFPCLSPIIGFCSNSCPLSQWCHPTISSFVSPSPPASNLSSIRVFSNESVLHTSPTHWTQHWCWERLNAKREGTNRGWDS